MENDEHSFEVEEVEFPRDTPDDIAKKAMEGEGRYSIAGLIAGLIVIVLGVLLLILGITGDVDWSFEGLDLSSEIQTGAIGVVIAIIGLLVIAATRHKVKITNGTKKEQ